MPTVSKLQLETSSGARGRQRRSGDDASGRLRAVFVNGKSGGVMNACPIAFVCRSSDSARQTKVLARWYSQPNNSAVARAAYRFSATGHFPPHSRRQPRPFVVASDKPMAGSATGDAQVVRTHLSPVRSARLTHLARHWGTHRAAPTRRPCLHRPDDKRAISLLILHAGRTLANCAVAAVEECDDAFFAPAGNNQPSLVRALLARREGSHTTQTRDPSPVAKREAVVDCV